MAYNEELAERLRAKLKSALGMIEKKMFSGISILPSTFEVPGTSDVIPE